jgi:arylsulfatase A-like enzyme
VPLAVKMPGQQFGGKRIQEIIQPTDILPTILDLAGIDSRTKLPGKSHLPDREVIMENPGVIQGRQFGLPDFDGQSLLPLIRGEAIPWHRDIAITTRKMEPFVTGGMAGLSATREDASTLLWVTVSGRQHTLLLGGKTEDPPEFYDIQKDPKQENNVYSENKEIAKEMADALFAFAESAGIAHDVIEAYRSKLS